MLRLLAFGLTTRQVAERLVISAKTADHHVQHVYTEDRRLDPRRGRVVRRRARHLGRRPALMATAGADSDAVIGSDGPRLRGRGRALRRIGELRNRAAAGVGSVVLIAGEAGMGKTALCDAVLAEAKRDGWAVAWAGAAQASILPGLWPWGQLLVALDGGQLPQPPSDRGDPAAARVALFDAIVGRVRVAAAAAPVLAVLDDAHWTDPATLAMVVHFAATSRQVRACLLVTYRPEDAPASSPLGGVLADLRRLGAEVVLEPLAREDVAALAAETGWRAVAEADVDLLVETTRGNPLFVTEVVRLLDGRSPRELDRLPASPAIAATIAERVARLSAECREVLAVASAIGRRVRRDHARACRRLRGSDVPLRTSMRRSVRRSCTRRVRAPSRSGTPCSGRRSTTGSARRAAPLHTPGSRWSWRRCGTRAAPWSWRCSPTTSAAARRWATRRPPPGTRSQRATRRWRRWPTRQPASATGRRSPRWTSSRAPATASRSCSVGPKRTPLPATRPPRWPVTRWPPIAPPPPGGPRSWLTPRWGAAAGRAWRSPAATRPARCSSARWRPSGTASPRCGPGSSRGCRSSSPPPRRTDERARLVAEASALAEEAGDPLATADAAVARCHLHAGPDAGDRRLDDAATVVREAMVTRQTRLELLGRRLRIEALFERGHLSAVRQEIDEYERRAAQVRDPGYAYFVPLWRATLATAAGDEAAYRRERALLEQAVEALPVGSDGRLLARVQDLFHLVDVDRDAATAARRYRETIGVGRAGLPPQLAITEALILAVQGRGEDARALVARWDPEIRGLARDAEWIPALVQLADVAALTGGHVLARWTHDVLRPYADLWAVEGIGAALRGPVSRAVGVLAGVLGDPVDPGAPPEAVFHARLAYDAETWLVDFGGVASRVKDSKGMRDIAALVARPGVAVAALDLVAAGAPTVVEHDLGPGLDESARAAYRRRIAELDEALDAADRAGEAARSGSIAAEREMLIAELSRAVGLGGRSRRTGSSAERARTTVTTRVKDALRRLDVVHPGAARHLRRSLRTGTFCTYDPDPPAVWEVSPPAFLTPSAAVPRLLVDRSTRRRQPWPRSHRDRRPRSRRWRDSRAGTGPRWLHRRVRDLHRRRRPRPAVRRAARRRLPVPALGRGARGQARVPLHRRDHGRHRCWRGVLRPSRPHPGVLRRHPHRRVQPHRGARADDAGRVPQPGGDAGRVTWRERSPDYSKEHVLVGLRIVGGSCENGPVSESRLVSAHRLVEEALGGLAAAAETASDDELVSLLAVCEGASRRLEQLSVAAIGALCRRGVFAERGYRTPVAGVVRSARVRPGRGAAAGGRGRAGRAAGGAGRAAAAAAAAGHRGRVRRRADRACGTWM